MNILFIDNNSNFNNKIEKFLYYNIGYYIRKYNEYYSLSLNVNHNRYIALNWLIKKILFKNDLLVVRSKKVDYLPNIKHIDRKYIDVKEQNNLFTNDKLYIHKYLEKSKIRKEESKVLIIIDNLGNIEKEKILECIKNYKEVDVYVTRVAQYFYTQDYVKTINEEYGTTSQTLDKLPKLNYNILLVFSRNNINISNNSSFILDYNNCDLDTDSNTYKVYLKNKKEITYIFNTLGMIEENYWKTKLGKLYIYKNWNTLDK